MACVVDDEIDCCVDCLMIVANNDASGMDDETEKRCRDGIHALQSGTPGGYLACGDSDEDDEFSWRGCDVCGSSLGGSRHRLVLLGDEVEEDGDGE